MWLIAIIIFTFFFSLFRNKDITGFRGGQKSWRHIWEHRGLLEGDNKRPATEMGSEIVSVRAGEASAQPSGSDHGVVGSNPA